MRKRPFLSLSIKVRPEQFKNAACECRCIHARPNKTSTYFLINPGDSSSSYGRVVWEEVKWAILIQPSHTQQNSYEGSRLFNFFYTVNIQFSVIAVIQFKILIISWYSGALCQMILETRALISVQQCDRSIQAEVKSCS